MTTSPERSRWSRWHDSYDDPASPLSKRLSIVKGFLRSALDAHPPGPIRLVSLCAGQGRDVIEVLGSHPRSADVTATLVELDPGNVAYARSSASALPQVRVIEGDASDTSLVAESVPADVLLLCGIFGHLSPQEIESTVRDASRLCAAGATVIWTAGRGEPDRTVDIRRWFDAAGWELIGFESGDRGPGKAPFAVGCNRLIAQPMPFAEMTLFHFGSGKPGR